MSTSPQRRMRRARERQAVKALRAARCEVQVQPDRAAEAGTRLQAMGVHAYRSTLWTPPAS